MLLAKPRIPIRSILLYGLWPGFMKILLYRLKGHRIGGAMVSMLHANFIVNDGDATSGDVLGLIEHVRETVRDRFGVNLELEVKVV